MILQFLFGCIGQEKKQRLQHQQQKRNSLKRFITSVFIYEYKIFYDNSLTAIPSIIWQKHRKPFLS